MPVAPTTRRDAPGGQATAAATRPRRVVFCTNRYRTYDRRIYDTLAAAFELRVIWVNPPPADEPVPAWTSRIRWSVVADDPGRLTLRDVRRSAALFRLAVREARGCDLVIGSTSTSWKARVIYAAARVARVPVALRTDIWRDRPSGRPAGARAGWQRRVTDYLERHADGVLVSGVKAAEFLAARGVAAEQILPFRYLHPDLAAEPLDAELVDRLRRIKGDRIGFLYLGRVMPQKGLVPLIRVFRAILAGGRDAVLFVVGGPITTDTGRGTVSQDYFDEARRLAEGEPRVVFLGPAAPEQVPSYYAAADVFLHPHIAVVEGYDVHEGWGNVITEAACMSMPIVATDRIPACFDLVEPGVNGYLLPAAHLEAELGGALTAFIDEPGRVARFGDASRRRFETFADPALNVATVQRVIERAASGRAR